MLERENFVRLINKMNAAHYLECNPYSKIGNSRMGDDITSAEKIFFDYFLIQSNYTLERLVTTGESVLDPSKNTIFITGYRGCGKTTFSKYLQAMIEKRISIPSLDQCLKDELALNDGSNSEQIENTKRNYSSTETKIRVALKKNGIQNNSLQEFVQDALLGQCFYMNFEVGISKSQNPVKEKLNKEVSALLKHLISKKEFDVLNKICSIFRETSEIFYETFESADKHPLGKFFGVLTQCYCDRALYSDIEQELLQALNALGSNQLLCIYSLINLIIANKTENKLFFIFDNIDVIFDVSTLEDFVQEYVIFVENFSELLPEINKLNILDHHYSFYEDMTYIFVMRETSAMQISDHFTDRLYDVSMHFDISLDIKKRIIVRRKLKYLKEAKDRITNSRLFHVVQHIDAICQDYYIDSNVFSLFNNDYKRSMNCLAKICENYESEIEEELQLIRENKNYDKHGARGIVFRLIFDHFKSKEYFDKLELNQERSHYNDFSPSRVILTYLNNIQPKHNDQFLIDDSDLVSLHELYISFISLLSPATKRAAHQFVDALWAMYDLRKSETWNHLITFDSISTVEKGVLIKQIEKYEKELEFQPDIRLRITCAGRTFVNFVCTHFEFFACRFTTGYKPLFCVDNLQKNEKGIYKYETLIEMVFEETSKCIKKLNEFTRMTLLGSMGYTLPTLLQSKYVHRRQDRSPLLHEERIIHQHIGYIEAYREHLIRSRHMNAICINRKMVPLIEKYLGLLVDNELYGNASRDLFNDLSKCIEFIKGKDYDDDTTDISRDGAKQFSRTKQ